MAIDNAQSSSMMKTTQSGRPFVKDIHDLFSTLVITLPFESHRYLFKAYPNTFIAESAILSLAELRFSQTNKSADPKNAGKVISTTITTTFSMTRDMARNLCQICTDARLIENSQDPPSRSFKDKGIYGLTPKGSHVLERFLKRSGMSVSGEIETAIYALPTISLLTLDRSTYDDDLILTTHAVASIFKRFAGAVPNDISGGRPSAQATTAAVSLPTAFRDLSFSASASAALTAASPNHLALRKISSDASSNESSDSKSDNRNLGIEVKERLHGARTCKYTFTGLAAIEWLLDLTTAINKDEATAIATEFVRLGYIENIRDDERPSSSDATDTLFSALKSTLYQLTGEGRRVAGWDQSWDDVPHRDTSRGLSAGAANGAAGMTGANGSGSAVDIALGADRARERALQMLGKELDTEDEVDMANIRAGRINVAGRLGRSASMSNNGGGDLASMSLTEGKETNATKLRQILEDPTLLILFRDHLRQQFCEENIAFWLAHRELSQKYRAVFDAQKLGQPHSGQRDLLNHAFSIYDSYLGPSAPNELNISHTLHQEIIQYMDALVATVNDRSQRAAAAANAGRKSDRPLNARQSLLDIVNLFEKVYDHVYRLMATDSVPKFTRTDKYREIVAVLHGKRDSGTAA